MNNQMCKYSSFLSFLGHPITVCFAELIFTSLLRISHLNTKSRHYVALATPRALPGRRAKCLYEEKLSRLPGLPCLPRWDISPTFLAPRDEFAFIMWTVDWILERNKINVTSARVTRGEGCLGYPRPYKWGLSKIKLSLSLLSLLTLFVTTTKTRKNRKPRAEFIISRNCTIIS